MRVRHSSLAGFLLSIAAEIHAASFFSPPMNVKSGDLDLVCSIVNVSSGEKAVRIRIFNDNGQQAFDTGNTLLGGGGVESVRLPSGVATTAMQYCRFDVEGRKAGYRASAALRRHSGDEDVVVVVPEWRGGVDESLRQFFSNVPRTTFASPGEQSVSRIFRFFGIAIADRIEKLPERSPLVLRHLQPHQHTPKCGAVVAVME